MAVVGLDSPEALVEGVGVARDAGASAAEFFGERFLRIADLSDLSEIDALARSAWGLLLIEVEGLQDQVDASLAEISRRLGPGSTVLARSPEERAAAWAIRHRASPRIAEVAGRRTSTQFIEDSVVPVAQLPRYLEGLERLLEDAGLEAVVFGHAGDGNVHVNPLVDFHDPDWRDGVRRVLLGVADLVRSVGGTLSGEHGDGRIRAPLLETIWGGELVEAFREVKRTLDPSETLNPGVVLPLPGQDPLDGMGVHP